MVSWWIRSNAPANTGTNEGSTARKPVLGIPRARWAASTVSNSRWRVGMSWRVIVSMRFARYGIRSRANAADQSLGWVVVMTASATDSTARSRPA